MLGRVKKGIHYCLLESRCWSHFQLCRRRFIALIAVRRSMHNNKYFEHVFPSHPYRVLVIKISENDVCKDVAVGVQYEHERYLVGMREHI